MERWVKDRFIYRFNGVVKLSIKKKLYCIGNSIVGTNISYKLRFSFVNSIT